jgi:hypothetical protein
MHIVKVGYYNGRNKARVPVDRGAIKASLGRQPDRMRLETLEGAIVLTDVRGPAWRDRDV